VSNFKVKEEEVEVTSGHTNKLEVTLGLGVSVTDSVVIRGHSREAIAQPDRYTTLTVEVKNESDGREKVEVTLRRVGCNCGECPVGKNCPSACCDCKNGDCVCCIVAGEVTGGARSFRVQPGDYDVSFKVANRSWGTFSGVTVAQKEVKLPVTILKVSPMD